MSMDGNSPDGGQGHRRQRVSSWAPFDYRGPLPTDPVPPPIPRRLSEYTERAQPPLNFTAGLSVAELDYKLSLDLDQLVLQEFTKWEQKRQATRKKNPMKRPATFGPPPRLSEIREWEEMRNKTKAEENNIREQQLPKKEGRDPELAYVRKYQRHFQRKIDKLNEVYDPDGTDAELESIVESVPSRRQDTDSSDFTSTTTTSHMMTK